MKVKKINIFRDQFKVKNLTAKREEKENPEGVINQSHKVIVKLTIMSRRSKKGNYTLADNTSSYSPKGVIAFY